MYLLILRQKIQVDSFYNDLTNNWHLNNFIQKRYLQVVLNPNVTQILADVDPIQCCTTTCCNASLSLSRDNLSIFAY